MTILVLQAMFIIVDREGQVLDWLSDTEALQKVSFELSKLNALPPVLCVHVCAVDIVGR